MRIGPNIGRTIRHISIHSNGNPSRKFRTIMKMNIGIDASTGSAATPPHMRSTMSDRPIIENTPRSEPASAKNRAIPP
jgi:hypothetical protein